MKKVVLSLAFVAAVLVSCNKKAEGAEGTEVAQDGYGRFALDRCSSGISQEGSQRAHFCRSDRAVSPLWL